MRLTGVVMGWAVWCTCVVDVVRRVGVVCPLCPMPPPPPPPSPSLAMVSILVFKVWGVPYTAWVFG